MNEPTAPSRLAILVHEVRSPVAALSAIREALGARHDEPDARSELVRLVLAACVAIERIATDASVATLDLRPVDITRLLRDTAAAAELRGGRVRAADAPDVPEAVVDPVRIRQALDNLVANALAHTSGDGEVLLDARVEGEDVVLSVTDSGPGIPEAEQARIFEPGVRLGSAYPGSGLGLAVVRAIAEAHGGRVTVRSAPAEGATISLAVPLEPVQPATTA
jgi:two-component system OmpR family sensor kinase